MPRRPQPTRGQPRTRPTAGTLSQPTPSVERERAFNRQQQNYFTQPRQVEQTTMTPQFTPTDANLPVDCVLTDWSDWSHCSVTCGVGRQEKIREIITDSQNGGLPCPKKLFKRRRCALSPCAL